MYEKELSELGLTDNEIKIYLLLLERGNMGPTEIAKKIGLHRTYIYDALDRMLEKEVINEISIDSKKSFQATNPQNLAEIYKFKLENLQKIIPELNKLENLKQEETKVEMYTGSRVYRTLLKDISSSIKNRDEVCLIGVDEKALDSIEPLYLQQYFTIIKEKKVRERIILEKGKKKFNHKNLHYKELNSKYLGPIEESVYADKVAIFLPKEPLQLIIIKNKELADYKKKMFELLWDVAK